MIYVNVVGNKSTRDKPIYIIQSYKNQILVYTAWQKKPITNLVFRLDSRFTNRVRPYASRDSLREKAGPAALHSRSLWRRVGGCIGKEKCIGLERPPTLGGRPIESQLVCTARISARHGVRMQACTHAYTHTHINTRAHAHMRISVCDAFPTDATNAAADSCGLSAARNRSSHRAAVQRARSKISPCEKFIGRVRDRFFFACKK